MCRSISSVLAAALPVAQAPAAHVLTGRLPGFEALPSWLDVSGPDAGFPDADTLQVRWLGTAGFEVRTAETALLIDPYLSRLDLASLLRHPARPDPARVTPYLRPADAILIGHSHFDHLLDAPFIARRLGCPLYGSRDSLRVARAEGTDESLLREIKGGDRLEIGDLVVEVVESRHSGLFTQWLVGGPMPDPVRLPMRFLSYKCGPVFNFRIRWRDRLVYHIGSAEVLPEPLEGGPPVDVVLACINGWKSDPGVFQRMARLLRPRVVVPMHHDDFFRPFEAGLRIGPIVHEAQALERIRKDVPGASAVGLDFFTTLHLHS